MKKILLTAIAVTSLLLASCGSGIDSKLDRLEEIEKELMAKENGGEEDIVTDINVLGKRMELVSEADEIREELRKVEKDMTEVQKSKFEKFK